MIGHTAWEQLSKKGGGEKTRGCRGMFLAFGSRKGGSNYWGSEKGYFVLKRDLGDWLYFHSGMRLILFAIKLFRFDF